MDGYPECNEKLKVTQYVFVFFIIVIALEISLVKNISYLSDCLVNHIVSVLKNTSQNKLPSTVPHGYPGFKKKQTYIYCIYPFL